jgi:hypothetical protein
VLAHGLGGRTDLPVDPMLAAGGAAFAVAFTVLVIPSWWRTSRLEDSESERPLPAALGGFLDAAWFTHVLRSLALVVSVFVTVVAFVGPTESRFNLAPYALYVVFWVGLVPASLLFGPVWRKLNPLRLVHAGLCRMLRVPDYGLYPLPAPAGLWPAAGWLLIFVWLELVFPERATPAVVGFFLVLYAVVTLFLALLFGRRWFAAGDGFEVYSTLIGSLAPFGRRDDGTRVLRSPLRNLAAVPPTPGLTAVVAVLIGSTGFDGLTRTQLWQRTVPPDSLLLGTVGLLLPVFTVAALFLAAMRAGRRSAGRLDPAGGADALTADWFAHSLIPVALGYAIAHYFSFLLFEGQVALALASDPFRLGWDIFDTAERRLDYLLVSPATIAWVQVSAIVVGHILGILAAHDRALALLDHRRAVASQTALGLLMAVITGCGVLLLVSV